MAVLPNAPAIVVDRPTALIDATISIELHGFRHRQPVTLVASQTYADGSRWSSHATFAANDDGRVDVSREAPLSGTYDGVSPMGLLWSMERQSGAARVIPAGSIMEPQTIHLEATSPNGDVAKAALVRRVAGPGVTREIIRASGLVGTLFLPTGAGPHPTVLVLSGSGGGADEFRGAILASHGYAALALAYFAAEGLPRNLVNIPLEYFATAIAWVHEQTWFSDRLLAVWGSSRGGELALLLGATFPEINAVAAWVPSGLIFWPLGPSAPGDVRRRSAWTFRGQPFPFLQENNISVGTEPASEAEQPVAFSPFYRNHLRDKSAVERSAIPVERICGPVQLVSGLDDQMWPSSELADIAFRRLEAHRHPFPYRHLRYPDAGHMILVPYFPLTALRVVRRRVEGLTDLLMAQGGTPRADAEAGDGAWKDLLLFLDDAARARTDHK